MEVKKRGPTKAFAAPTRHQVHPGGLLRGRSWARPSGSATCLVRRTGQEVILIQRFSHRREKTNGPGRGKMCGVPSQPQLGLGFCPATTAVETRGVCKLCGCAVLASYLTSLGSNPVFRQTGRTTPTPGRRLRRLPEPDMRARTPSHPPPRPAQTSSKPKAAGTTGNC